MLNDQERGPACKRTSQRWQKGLKTAGTPSICFFAPWEKKEKQLQVVIDSRTKNKKTARGKKHIHFSKWKTTATGKQPTKKQGLQAANKSAGTSASMGSPSAVPVPCSSSKHGTGSKGGTKACICLSPLETTRQLSSSDRLLLKPTRFKGK